MDADGVQASVQSAQGPDVHKNPPVPIAFISAAGGRGAKHDKQLCHIAAICATWRSFFVFVYLFCCHRNAAASLSCEHADGQLVAGTRFGEHRCDPELTTGLRRGRLPPEEKSDVGATAAGTTSHFPGQRPTFHRRGNNHPWQMAQPASRDRVTQGADYLALGPPVLFLEGALDTRTKKSAGGAMRPNARKLRKPYAPDSASKPKHSLTHKRQRQKKE